MSIQKDYSVLTKWFMRRALESRAKLAKDDERPPGNRVIKRVIYQPTIWVPTPPESEGSKPKSPPKKRKPCVGQHGYVLRPSEPQWHMDMAQGLCTPISQINFVKYTLARPPSTDTPCQTEEDIWKITGAWPRSESDGPKRYDYFVMYDNYVAKMRLGYMKEVATMTDSHELFDFNVEASKVARELRNCMLQYSYREFWQDQKIRKDLDVLEKLQERYFQGKQRIVRLGERERKLSAWKAKDLEKRMAAVPICEETRYRMRIITFSRDKLNRIVCQEYKDLYRNGLVKPSQLYKLETEVLSWIECGMSSELQNKCLSNAILDDLLNDKFV